MLKELVRANRSCRGYDESYHFTEQQLLDLIDLARLTASSVNMQPLKYFIAWEPERVASIQKLTRWARQLPELQLPHPGKCPTAFIVILQDTGINPNLARFQKDIGIAAQTILLGAVEQGLGGCMIGNFTADEVKQTLSLSESLQPMLIVALGKPAEEIVLTEILPGEDVRYYRDENDVHYVPKRRLEDIVLK